MKLRIKTLLKPLVLIISKKLEEKGGFNENAYDTNDTKKKIF